MAIQIVVDGYNLIGSERGLRGDLEGKRNRLIQRLQKYRGKKGFGVIVVFDGWRSGWPTEVQQQS
ncbi:MAG: NYN domain-containing protein, partial [Candidatus Binatia bacterium]